jgi:glycosyltransferase involved in cell wall biosynthesis
LPDQPRISIVTPSFNHAAFLERTIDSVVRQAYPALDYIVQDGGSTDGTAAILQRRSAELTAWDSRPDAGQSAAINAGFRRTTGAIMAYLNSDDVLMPGALSAVAAFMSARPDVDVVYSHGLMIDEHDRPVVLVLLPGHSSRALRIYNYIPQMTMFWRRAIWDRIGGSVDESLHYAMDWDLLLRFSEAGARFMRLPTLLGGFRLHGGQKIRTIRASGSREADALRARHAKRSLSLMEVVLRSSPHLLRRAWCVAMFRLGFVRIQIPWAHRT